MPVLDAPEWLGGREKSTVLGLLAAVVVILASGLVTIAARAADRPAPAVASPPAAPRAAGPASRSLALEPAARPLRLRIPAIGVDAPVVSLGLNQDGTLQVPRYHEAGWYAGGSRPGETGPAVIVAHLDSTTGPAVFHRLKDLRPGQQVHIDYGAVTVTFATRTSRRFGKSRFPTAQVYGSTAAPELRLVTCDGRFDRKTRSYTANLIVWADLARGA